MLGLLGGGENIRGWLTMMELLSLGESLHENIIILGVSLHEDNKADLSQRQDAAAETQTAEPLVILTACLVSFVVREHEMRPSGTCYHLNYHCRVDENSANFEKFKQKTRHKH